MTFLHANFVLTHFKASSVSHGSILLRVMASSVTLANWVEDSVASGGCWYLPDHCKDP